jgi:hypothetical protein
MTLRYFFLPGLRHYVLLLAGLLGLLTIPAVAQTAGRVGLTVPAPPSAGAPAPAVRTNALVVEQLTITGGTPGAGKVLTSDAVGAGKWSAAPQTATLVYTSSLPEKAASTRFIPLPEPLRAASIVGITAVVALDQDHVVPPAYTALADLHYQVSVVGQQIRLDTSNSSKEVLGRPVRVLLTYLP